MHLLQARPGAAGDGAEAVDLNQTPGDIVVLSAADTELATLAAAQGDLGDGAPSLRLANVMHLGHPMSVDLYVERNVACARLVVVRLLGGAGYWPYGVEQISLACKQHGVKLALLPGDDQPDQELAQRCTVPADAYHRLWQYLVHGGRSNARQFLRFAASLFDADTEWLEPAPLARAGVYRPGAGSVSLEELRADWCADAPVAAIVFYRALLQADNLAPVDALCAALREQGLNALPLFCASLKEPVSAGMVESLLDEAGVELILNATGFAISQPGAERTATPFDVRGCPVLQVVFSGGEEQAWAETTGGLSARDIAMNVALPEVDGRVLSRAVSFKSEARFDDATQSSVVEYAVRPDRVAFVADLARRYVGLARTPAQERRIGIVLANYPNRDGRLGNGVGLDTPAGTMVVLRALAGSGYAVGELPADGNALIEGLSAGPTNASIEGRVVAERLPLACYQAFFDKLPAQVRASVTERWGDPEVDPGFLSDSNGGAGAFAIAALRFGHIAVGIQPARGYQIDPVASYHDPDLVPPHGYIAFYAWLREHFGAHAVLHMGKHGNLEWLPGKALALSEDCFPEAVLGPLPHVYPFIVNDPGEGTQAKRRAQAVIVDHLTPPLARAESYGPLADLELLVDEYYEAAGVDPRRLALLRDQILESIARIGIDKDCGIAAQDDPDTALGKLDGYLCELKEMQIRDGLHIFGESPRGERRDALLVALTRLPRAQGHDGDASIVRALSADLGLDGFDPLDCDMAAKWTWPRPTALQGEGAFRTNGDAVERIELLALDLVAGRREADPNWTRTRAVLAYVRDALAPVVEACGNAEVEGVLTALAGRFLEPGASGAPTRGRPDVLPTGRNFYSVDTRTVPTPAAWQLGWKSAALLIERYRQDHGEWPQRMALSAWGTSNMRTGGDDIAQALALMGVQPRWEPSSRRVVGFEIMPADILDRPRVDVTLRISGFFRDAFPALVDLFDAAARAVAALDEPPAINPLAARARSDAMQLRSRGVPEKEAAHRAGYRVFGSKPGAYGAGLQALIDERGWDDAGDLARAYVAWGGYAYGQGTEGVAEHGLFESRLSAVQAVVHNQDNREHDLLDSDDYYQFEGGLAAAVTHLGDTAPAVYHNDHSRPESPRIRALHEEIARVVRARAVNPKWIEGVMRHGYKGAFEIAATVDYLFAFAATTRAVADHHFDAIFEAYVEDDRVRDFMQTNNPAALKEMAERLIEALERNLWRPRSNSARNRLHTLAVGAG